MIRRRFLFLIGVLIFLAGVISPCLNTNNLCGRWFLWRAPTIDSFSKYPQITLQNDVNNISELRYSEYNSVFNKVIYKDRTLESFLEGTETAAFIVYQDGLVVYENYFNGATSNSLYCSFSITKSIVSALLGIAVDQGHISSVKDSVANYIPELTGKFDAVTLENLLTMNSGVQYRTIELFGSVPAWWSDDYRAAFSPNMRSTLVNLDLDNSPLTEFEYNNFNPGLIGMAIENATSQSLAEFAHQNFWRLMGAEYPASWSVDHDEHQFPQTDGGFNARAIDLLRFGLLYLNNGHWNGQQIISKEWVEQSTTEGNNLLIEKNLRYLETSDVADEIKNVIASWRYYYLWWGVEREGHSAIFANGHFGQFIYIIPERDTVIVRTGSSWGERMNDDEWLSFFYFLSNNLDSVID